jgi:hypothetical protein
MFKTTLLGLLLISYNICWTQTIDGNYRAFELNGLSIDSTGNIYFYGIDSFPKQKWYYEVSITIKGNQITVDKKPIWFKDSLKSYSASDGGFITYRGTLTKLSDTYIAKTKMVDYDYMGLSFFDSPKISDDYNTTAINQFGDEIQETEKIRLAKYDRIKKNGTYVYFEKGLLRQDFVIRPDKGGIWINNVFYRRQKKKYSP